MRFVQAVLCLLLLNLLACGSSSSGDNDPRVGKASAAELEDLCIYQQTMLLSSGGCVAAGLGEATPETCEELALACESIEAGADCEGASAAELGRCDLTLSEARACIDALAEAYAPLSCDAAPADLPTPAACDKCPGLAL
jgi:hypothetical protein